MMYAFVLSMAVMVAVTPQMVMFASLRFIGKPVPTRCSPYPPFVPPEVMFKLVSFKGKLKGTTPEP